ncbi:MAG TPA: FtsX-like permease family protein [Bryobacteraceae bacterium]
MRSSLALFWRLIVRPLANEPVRTALTLLAVALGVSIVVAIDLAGDAAAGSFHSSLESLTGKGNWIITGTGGLDEHLLGRLVTLPYPLNFSPRIESFAALNGKGEALPFIGLDEISEIGTVQPRAPASDVPNGVWAGPGLNWHVGQRVRLLINDSLHEFTVQGILPGENNRAIVADIGVAQVVTNSVGRLDSIEVKIPASDNADTWRKAVQRELPPGVRIEPQGSRTRENQRMLRAFRWNLRVLSYIALVVGAFLIYNTIAISVVRRRNEIGVVRALGGGRGLIFTGFLAEAAFFAICGSALGLLLGRILAIGAVRLIGNTVEALYVSSRPAPIALSVEALAAGAGLGLAVSLVAALGPAMEAARVAPVEALARGREEYLARIHAAPRAWLAVALFIAAAFCARLPAVDAQPFFGYLSVLLLVVAVAAIIPGLISTFVRISQNALLRLAGVEALLAGRSLAASLGRTSILTAALVTAVAMTVSVAIMVGSFRATVAVWMNNELKADFYLRSAGRAAADQHPTMSPDVADRIEKLPGVSAVDRFRAYAISYEGLPATLAGGESSRVRAADSARFLPGQNASEILAKLSTGDYAIVSEPFANKHNVRVGDNLHLPLAGAIRNFRVLGIYYDYSTERGFIVLDRKTLLKYLPDPAVSNLAVYLQPGADAAHVRSAIDSVLNGRSVFVFSNSSLRRAALATFDRTFRITWALEAVAIAVAVMGVAGALLAMVLDRRRELALLRFLGAAGSQVRKLLLCEAGLVGLIANTVGLALGTVLSLILIFVINKQSFGWTIQLHWPAGMLLTVAAGVYAATVLAALYPARTALRMDPIESIHEE